jgi:MFS family permease
MGDAELEHLRVRGDPDFSRLWAGLAVSQLGSAVGSVALPVVAVTALGATTVQVSALAACAAVTTTVAALPLGALIEHRRKRPLMIASDTARALALASIPVAAACGLLTFAQLCVVAAFTALGQLAFAAAAQAHLRGLVGRERLVDANGRLQSTLWLSYAVGPSAGGGLIGVLGAAGALWFDAGSFLASALAVRLIRRREPLPPPPATVGRWPQLSGGLRFVGGHPTLRLMLLSWLLFAGSVAWLTPVETVFYLRDLHFSAWQYGLLMGIPSLGGLLGSRLCRRLVVRSNPVRVVWWTSVLRGPWQLLIPLAVPGLGGLILSGVGFFGVLLFAGAVNAGMASYRQMQTPENLMSRVAALWSLATTAVQPLFALAGGLVATATSPRFALVAGAVLMNAAVVLLPRGVRHLRSSAPAVVASRSESL